MRARKIPKAFRVTAVAFAAALLVSDGAWAQQKHPIATTGEGVKSRYVQQHVIDVGDASGHQLRIQETQRTNPSSGHAIDGVKITEDWVRGFSNYTNGVGPAWGYFTWIMEDGSKIFGEYIGTSESQTTAAGSRRGTYHGVARITGGTGRFGKIRGQTVDISEFDTDPVNGYNRVSTNGEYWFQE